MAVDLYQPFTNPVTRETFRCLCSDEEAYITAWIVQAGGCVPIEHIHPNQDEILHIEQGEVRVRLNGRDRIGVAGQTVTIPRGARHIACNPKSGDASLHARISNPAWIPTSCSSALAD